jgi:hypothetical protein
MILESLEDRCLLAPFSASFLNAVAAFDQQGATLPLARSEPMQNHSPATIAYGATHVDSTGRAAHSVAAALGEQDWDYRAKGKDLDALLEHLIRREFNAVYVSSAGENADVLHGIQALSAAPSVGGGLASKTALTNGQPRAYFVESTPAVSAWMYPSLSAWNVDHYQAADELVVDSAQVERIYGEASLASGQGPERSSGMGMSAVQDPGAGTPLMGLMSVDLAALERRMDALFSRLGQLAAEPTSAHLPGAAGPWLALAAGAVYQMARWRRDRSSEEVVPGVDNVFSPIWLPHRVLV